MKTVLHSSEQSETPRKNENNKRRLERLLREMLASGNAGKPRRAPENPVAFYRRVIE